MLCPFATLVQWLFVGAFAEAPTTGTAERVRVAEDERVAMRGLGLGADCAEALSIRGFLSSASGLPGVRGPHPGQAVAPAEPPPLALTYLARRLATPDRHEVFEARRAAGSAEQSVRWSPPRQ